MSRVTPDAVPRPRLDVRMRTMRGVMTVVRGEVAFELSDSARFIWKKIDGQRSAAELGALVADEYDIDPGAARADTIEILQELTDHEFLDLPGG